MLKDGNIDVNQVVLDNRYNMSVIEFPTQRNDGQVDLLNSEVNKKIVQISEANVKDIMFTIRRKV